MNNIYKHAIVLLLILIAQNASSAVWERMYSKNSTDCFRCVREVPAGGFVVAGYTSNFTPNDTDGIVIRYNSSGDTLWTFVYDGPSSKEDCFYKILPTADGGFVVCGYSRSFGSGDNAIYLKLNSNGQLQWIKNWGGSGIERAQDIIELSNGKFVICGYTTSSPAHYYDAFILKIDANGSTSWSKVYGGNSYDDANSIKLLSDGGFILGGQTASNMYLIRTDSNGDSLWTKSIGTSGIDNIESIIVTQNEDGYVLAGTTDGLGSGGEDGYLVRTDTSGNEIWSETYGGNLNDGFHRIEYTSDGGFVLSGTSSEGPWNDPNIWIMKVDSGGVMAWENFFGGNNHDHGYSGQQTSDGGYIVVGHTHSFHNNDFIEDGLVVKMNSSGQVSNRLNYTTVTDLVTPSAAACGSSNVQVQVKIANFGEASVNNIPVTIEITGAITQTLNQTYSSSVSRDQEKTLTFTTPIDMSMGGTFHFHCFTGNQHDVIPARNILDKTLNVGITSLPPSVTNGTHCGPGTVDLSASSPDPIKWYATASGGSSLNTGSNFTTPYITADSVFYAQAGANCPSTRVAVNASITPGLTPPAGTDGSRCGQGTVILGGSGSNTITWYSSASSLNVLGTGTTFTTQSIGINNTYYIAAESPTCSSIRVAVHAIVNQMPIDPTTTNGQRCGSGIVQLTAAASDPLSWYANAAGGNPLSSSSTFNTPSISTTTIYYVESNDGTCSSNRIPVTAVINQVPSLPVVNGGSSCGSGAVLLTAASSDSINWYDALVNGTLVGTGTSFNTPVITNTATYYVQTVNANCVSAMTPVSAFIFSLPVVNIGPDTIFSSGSTVMLDAGGGFSSYLWSTSDITQTFVVSASGNYCVTVTNGNNCTASTCTYVEMTVGIKEINAKQLYVYPNPTNGRITIELPNKEITGELAIIDLTGKAVYFQKITSNNLTIDISFLSKGVYFTRVTNEKSVLVNRIVLD